MQSNGSPPKKFALGGSIKSTSLTHKHNKILNNLKSLQYNNNNNNIKDSNIKDKDKDKEPLLKSSSSNLTIIDSIIPSLSSEFLSSQVSLNSSSSQHQKSTNLEEENLSNILSTSLATSSLSFVSQQQQQQFLTPTSSKQISTTNTLQQQQQQQQLSNSISSVLAHSNIFNKEAELKSSGSSQISSIYPTTNSTINKDNNNRSNISFNTGNTSGGINTTNPKENIICSSIYNNTNINTETASNNNHQIYSDQYHHHHPYHHQHQPVYYSFSYSRNITQFLGGGGVGCGGGTGSSGIDDNSSSSKAICGTGNLITTTSSLTSSLASSSSNSHHLYNSSSNNNNSNNNIMGGNSKRHFRKHTWGTRERAGMSFLIVIAFFAVFGLIILTELFMIDDKNRGGIVMLRHGNINNRMMDSIQPDYDNPKYGDDYDQPNQFGILPRTKHTDEIDPLRMKTNRLAWNEMLESRLEQTLPHYPVGETPTDGIWKVVNGTRFKFFVYSAYYDRRTAQVVRVIGATKTRRPEKVFCRLWYLIRDPLNSNRTKYTSATLSAKVKIIREHWNLKYSAVFVLCPVPPQDTPFAVSIVSRLRAPPGNILQLRNTNFDPDFANRTYNQIPDKMAVCVKPFHFNYDQALYLMEYLELNTLLGVSHFTFYNHTIGPHATCVLQHYASGDIPHGNLTTSDYFNYQTLYSDVSNKNRNSNNPFDVESNMMKNGNNVTKTSTTSYPPPLTTQNPKTTTSSLRENAKIYKTKNYVVPTVQILPWDLRMRSQMEIRTEGLFAALNDCLYRNMYRYKYLALIDVDEFLMPKNSDTLNDLLRWLNRKYNIAQVGSYSFQNAFFYLQFADDSRLYETPSKNAALRGALITQRKTRRRLRLHPQKQRSKYIVNPEAVVEAGNHFVWDFIPGKKTFNVPADSGILHHYRVCEFGGDDCVKVPSILDRTAIKYTNRLIERVQKVYNYLKKPCKLDNLPSAPTRPPPTRRKVLQIRSYNATNKNNQNILELTEAKRTVEKFFLLSKNRGGT